MNNAAEVIRVKKQAALSAIPYLGPKSAMSWQTVMGLADAAETLVAENEKLHSALAAADDLLRRLSEWDMLYVAPDGKPITADGPYWQAEISRTRTALDVK